MTMTTLGTLILANLLLHRPPGRSPYSFEALPECGGDPKAPTCQLEPVCPEKAFWCAQPRWSEARGAWAKVETRETGTRRYAGLAEDLAAVTRYVTRCVGEDGIAVETCERARWWNGAQDLAMVGATLIIFEAGVTEGVQNGYPPLGLGADGEVSMMGIMPEHAAAFASWLPREERERLSKAGAKEQRAWAMRELHGPNNVRHAIEVALRQMVSNRRRCRSDFGMFSAYASGRCATSAKTVPMRVALLNKMRAGKPKLPDWAVAALANPVKPGASGEHVAVFPVVEP